VTRIHPRAVGSELRQKVRHGDFRAVLRSQACEPVGALSGAGFAPDAHDDEGKRRKGE